MIVYREARLFFDCRDLARLKAEIELDHAMAARAGQVMVMVRAFAETERVRPVGKLDAVQHLHSNELFNGAVDGGPPDPRILSPQQLQEIFG